MKTINELLNATLTLNDFSGLSAKEIMEEYFQTTYTNERIIVASYTNEGYDGSAWILFEKEGKLYEVHGGHCSCYGLEDQWTPEEVFLPELVNRVTNGKGYWNNEVGGALNLIFGLV